MFTFIQLGANGLAMGLVYVLLASGLNLIISISGILYIAYGQSYMLGAYLLWGLESYFHIPFFAALCLVALASAIVGIIVYVLIFYRIQMMDRQFLNGIVAALGLSLLLSQSVLLIFGTSQRGVNPVFDGLFKVGSLVAIGWDKVMLLVLGIIVLLVLHYVLQKTNIGRAMRAMSFNRLVSALQGVNCNWTQAVTMAIGCGLAGLAGGVMAPVFGITSTMGGSTLLVILIIVLGGIGSMVGTILAGLILGIVLSFGQYYIGTGVTQIVFFGFVGIMIFLKPGGLFGENTEITI